MDLKFPIIIYIDGCFSIFTEHVFIKILKANIREQKLSLLENRSKRIKSGWILDANGNYFILKAIGKSRVWMRPFSFFWNVVLSVYQMGRPRKVNAKYLIRQIELLPKKELRKEIVKDFLNFIKSEDSEQIVTGDTLKKWPL